MQNLYRISFVVLCGVIVSSSWLASACNSDVFPPCGQTIYLAKFAPSTVVNPGPSSAITVQIGLLPFVSWKLVSGCAQPSGASFISLKLTCTPAGGGTPIVVGWQTMNNLPTPTVPGIQNVGSFNYVIPAGTLPQGNFVCSVAGEYHVPFGPGTGTGTIIGTGDTEVCLVEPSPLDPSVPRLDMQCIDTSGTGMGYQACRRGDQTINYYLIANNDPLESVTLTFDSMTNQAARFPGGDNLDGTLFAISSSTPGTDNFPQAFLGDLNENGLITQPPPLDTIPDGMVTSDPFTLGPNEITIMPVAIRSHGMCADGSCSEVLGRVSGLFSDGSMAIGSVGTATVVQDVPAKSPLHEFTDMIEMGPMASARWTPTMYGFGEPRFDINEPFVAPIDSGETTFGSGNLDPATNGGATVFGQGSTWNTPTAGSVPSTDTVRVDSLQNSAGYEVRFLGEPGADEAFGGVLLHNMVEGETYDMPVVVYRDPGADPPGPPIDIMIQRDCRQHGVFIWDLEHGQELEHTGWEMFLGDLPPGFTVFDSTYRSITCTSTLTRPILDVQNNPVVAIVRTNVAGQTMSLSATDARDGSPLSWAASVNGAVSLRNDAGSAGDPIVLEINTGAVPEAPNQSMDMLTVSNESALNSPVVVPVALRKLIDETVDTDDDGIEDVADNCPLTPNSFQDNSDEDSHGDECDNCPNKANENQVDSDSDGVGDLCDNCVYYSNSSQIDTDGDGEGDWCDPTPYPEAGCFDSAINSCRPQKGVYAATTGGGQPPSRPWTSSLGDHLMLCLSGALTLLIGRRIGKSHKKSSRVR